MALDTTVGGSNSNSYSTVAEADAYFTLKGFSGWTGTDAIKEAHLINAAIYLENSYRGRWNGVKATSTQALAFPRVSLVDVDGYAIDGTTIPANIKKAQFEAAYLLLTGVSLNATIERNVKMEKIGQIQVEYSEGSASTAQYPQISGYLKDYIIGSVGVNSSVHTARVMRA